MKPVFRACCTLGAVVGAAWVAACSDPNSSIVVGAVVEDTLTAYALTGTPVSFPSAYYAAARAVTRADGNFNFDVAFDIDEAGQVVVYPQRLVGVPCVIGAQYCGGVLGAKSVGLQRIEGDFASLGRAPTSGYTYDSTFTLTPGQGLVLQVQSPSECVISFSTLLYSKIVLDSIDDTQRAVYFRAVHDPNCGYRGLVAGETPKN